MIRRVKAITTIHAYCNENKLNLFKLGIVGAGEPLLKKETIFSLLSQVMDEQQRNFQVVCQRFEFTDFFVVVRVGSFDSVVANDLEGVDDDEHGIGIFQLEFRNLHARACMYINTCLYIFGVVALTFI